MAASRYSIAVLVQHPACLVGEEAVESLEGEESGSFVAGMEADSGCSHPLEDNCFADQETVPVADYRPEEGNYSAVPGTGLVAGNYLEVDTADLVGVVGWRIGPRTTLGYYAVWRTYRLWLLPFQTES